MAHSTPLPVVLVGLGWWHYSLVVIVLGLVWLGHIGMDRMLSFDLKYSDRFQHTPLRSGG
jgi:hypothetical protein